MKRLFPILILWLSAHVATAQSVWYNLQPNDTLVTEAAFDNLHIFDIYQFNNQSDTIQLKWKLVSQYIPTGWDYSLCDYASCYPGLPASGEMFPVAPGDSGFLGLNVAPQTGFPGTAVVRMYVYEAAHPSEGDTLTWIVSTPQVSSVNGIVGAGVSLFPVPSDGLVYVQSVLPVNKLEVVTAVGQILLTQYAPGAVLDATALPAGSYFVRLQLASGAVVTKPLLLSR